jgi:hypothetical protein
MSSAAQMMRLQGYTASMAAAEQQHAVKATPLLLKPIHLLVSRHSKHLLRRKLCIMRHENLDL